MKRIVKRNRRWELAEEDTTGQHLESSQWASLSYQHFSQILSKSVKTSENLHMLPAINMHKIKLVL